MPWSIQFCGGRPFTCAFQVGRILVDTLKRSGYASRGSLAKIEDFKYEKLSEEAFAAALAKSDKSSAKGAMEEQ